jgi:two-component system cell cycle response regulator DivK
LDERRISPDRRVTSRGGRRHADHDGRPLVLIVDDHVDSRELIVAVLQDLGVTTAEAGTGSDALRRASSSPLPSVVLIDLTLPDCHGTDVVRALKASASTRHIPIIALSASVMASDKEAAARAGCAAFLEKPVMPDDVLDLVKRVMAEA